jgi:hypothetical protein
MDSRLRGNDTTEGFTILSLVLYIFCLA